MRFLAVCIPVLVLCNLAHAADIPDLTTALQNTYRACADIDRDLTEMKKLAGINTVITGVGTGLGVGATATGIAKARTDAKIAEWERILDEIIRNQTKDIQHARIINDQLDEFFKQYNFNTVSDVRNAVSDAKEKSKRLGNWRTGLLAGNTATNVAGAIIANRNKVDSDLQSKINGCVSAVDVLKNAINQARVAEDEIGEAQDIYNACREYAYLDLSPINKRAKGAFVSSAIGVVTGGIGTVTSAMANSDEVREGDKEKEKKLNKTANVMSAGSTIASASATVFNASQIAAIKKVVAVSERCSEVLK